MRDNPNRLFQRTVLMNAVKEQDHEKIQIAYEKCKAHFGNAAIQEKIRNTKETAYQGEFIKDFFVDILGYTSFPQENHNLVRELSNPNSAGRADGGIIFSEKVKAVIELKSLQTVSHLKSIEYQAFGYKVQHPDCRYVITSNFRKLRFYLDNTYQHEEFDLFTIDYDWFAVLYTILQKDNLERDLPLELKNQSFEKEQELTLRFYEDYQGFKEILFLNIAQVNKQFDKLLLFEKTQKLLDRIIFMCFASDKRLLPLNLIQSIIEEWKFVNDIGLDIKLYDRFKHHFKFINKGFRSRRYNIYGYNGGLFAPDEVLDSIQISDELLENRAEKISIYDFDNEIDINVLGHIFEHSLNELDQKRLELLADLETIEAGGEPNFVGKRKIEGVFYTPIHVTNYMIEETIGKFCQDKKTKLGLGESFVRADMNRDESEENITIYENWLKTLKVLDPACGSGAFLNQVLGFFIEEYAWVESQKAFFGKPEEPKNGKNGVEPTFDIFSEPAPTYQKKPKPKIHEILENNIFGVDLNSESVAITKLSLWLKTAQHRQKLNDLEDNIKIGNSLIDDKNLDPKAFDWKKEFPQVFENPENQGFTIIIGNPPYVRQELLKDEHKRYFSKRYPQVYSGVADLYVYFYAKGLELLEENGVLGYITPNKWFKTKYGEGLRRMLKPLAIYQIVDFFELQVFEEAATEPQIIILEKRLSDHDFSYFPVTETMLGEEGIEKFADKLNEKLIIEKSYLTDLEWTFTTGEKQAILDKIIGKTGVKTVSLQEYTNDKIFYGIKTGLNKAFIIDRKTRDSLVKKDARSTDLIKPYMHGIDIKKWHLEHKNQYFLIFTKHGTDIEKYPAIKTYLLNYFQELNPKISKKDLMGRKAGNYEWFEIQDTVAYADLFEKPKIMYIRTAIEHCFYYDLEGCYINDSCYIISEPDLFLSVYLNSKIFTFYKKLKFVAYGNPEDGGRSKLDYNKMIQVPVPVLTLAEKQVFEEKATHLQTWSEEMSRIKANAWTVFKAEFKPEKVSQKLQNWQYLDWEGFQDELKKQKATITPKQKIEWATPYTEQREKVLSLLEKIRATEQELDRLLYTLYGLSETEINMIENG